VLKIKFLNYVNNHTATINYINTLLSYLSKYVISAGSAGITRFECEVLEFTASITIVTV
jgi:hypothetical protein